MALGEQFLSRSITHTPTGASGTRVFIQTWADRYKQGLPTIGDKWPDDNLNPWVGLAPEGLWLHNIIPSPYAASGTKDQPNDVATHVKLEYMYESSKPISSDIAGWLISTDGVIATAEIGRERSFTLDTTHKIDGGKPRHVPMTEVVIRGLEYLGPGQPKYGTLAANTAAAIPRLGLVCSEIYKPTPGLVGASGQVLFESENTGEPFMRRTCQAHEEKPIAWYREFSRRFLVKRIIYKRQDNRNGIAGHNQEWDSVSKIWDTVKEPLYAETIFDFVLFPMTW